MNIEIPKMVDGKFQSKISKTFPLTGSGSASELQNLKSINRSFYYRYTFQTKLSNLTSALKSRKWKKPYAQVYDLKLANQM